MILKKNAFIRGNKINLRFFPPKKPGKTHSARLLLKAFLIYMIPVILICACVGFNKYQELENDAFSKIGELEETVSLQLNEIARYRGRMARQNDEIEKIAKKLETLELQLADLSSFEKRIRIVAEKELSDDAPLFGVGGSEEETSSKTRSPDDRDDMVKRMHERAERLSDASTDLKDSFVTYLSAIDLRNKRLAVTPSIIPVKGRTTSGFGYRTSPFTGAREHHKGIDIAAKEGTTIRAAADGVITYAGRKGSLGNLMTIDHGNGIVTRYGHIGKFLKKRGKRVKKGEPIAHVGDTGRSTGPHLHFEVRVNGSPVNPTKYMESTVRRAS